MPRANYAMKLDGPKNVRDLGGYPTQENKHTRWGQFLRSDNPFALTPEDCETLYRYGVRLQVDFRSAGECRTQPSPLQGYRDVEYQNIQLLDDLNSGLAEGDLSGLKAPTSMVDNYIELLGNAKEKFAQFFRLALRYPEACVLFNCTAGKDRTGVAAMLLLKAAHCADEVIIADYAATYENIRRDVEKLIQFYEAQGLTLPAHLFLSTPEMMEQTLLHFANTYGSIENWMDQAGLTPQELSALQQKLVG